MKKLFGGINLTWLKLVIFAIIAGVYTAVIAMIPELVYTSFNTITVTFEVWILFGIIIIMNSKSNLDSGLKCFVFFLISQPLVYIIQDMVNGSELFHTYYRFWIVWTIACFPMGFIGYYMKKDKWWGYLILLPMILFVGMEYSLYLSDFIFAMPRYILIVLFCIGTMIIYPLYIFNDKKIRNVGVIISGVLIAIITLFGVLNPPVYETQIMFNNKEHPFNDTYRAYLSDSKYGEVSIKYYESVEGYMLNAKFKKAGTTDLIIESPDGTKNEYSISIKRSTYKITKK